MRLTNRQTAARLGPALVRSKHSPVQSSPAQPSQPYSTDGSCGTDGTDWGRRGAEPDGGELLFCTGGLRLVLLAVGVVFVVLG